MMIKKPLADAALGLLHASTHGVRGARVSSHLVRASIVLACAALAGPSAYALALGRATVLSSLGESLQAEIDIPDINADEASSLRTVVASADAFKRAGLEYNPALSSLQISLQRRPDGSAFLRVRSDRVMNDPFVDLILEASWSAGRIVRDYTLLLDPPSQRQSQPVASIAPVVTPAAAPATALAAAPPAAPPRVVPAAVSVPAPARPPVAAARPVTQTGDTQAAKENQRVTVRAGDTATKIAASVKPMQVSLDQMLLALLRGNPNAFIGGNVNRIRAGAVLDVPSAEQAASVTSPEATQQMVAQSRDFNDFRRQLAGLAPVAVVDTDKRSASGKVQAKVDDKKSATVSPDKLSLQKAEVSVKGVKTSQDKIAAELQAKDAATRLAELNKNISDLNKLAAASAPAALATSAPTTVALAAVAAPAPPPAAPVSALMAPTLPVAATETAVVATVTTPAATTTAPPPAAALPKPVTPAATEQGFVADLLDNPWVPAAAGGLIALLGGLAFYRIRQRKKATQVDSSFMESRLQPDSFFGASGGQRVDTNDADGGNSSLAYSPSQLDAAADVDPVAEADVYLAYGRDLQAEEILKEALRVNSSRAAIHFKLLQIYAKRRDVKAYAATASEVHKLSRGLGSEWAQAAELGHELDPTNPLFMSGTEAEHVNAQAETQPLPLGDPAFSPESTFSTNMRTTPTTADAAHPAGVDVDLDLDFSDELDGPAAHATTEPHEPTVALQAATRPGTLAEPPVKADFDL
ncbi:MAG: hypothetical protein RLZZ401_1400, partial [Pseudomonadota bacterium]